MGEVHTIAIPPCDEHPPWRDWPDVNLIAGTCPRCMAFIADGTSAARELRARQLIREREAQR